MKYKNNLDILRKQIAEHAYIIPVEAHGKPDGSIHDALFKDNWKRKMTAFEKIRLWDKTPGYDDRDPRQEEPYLVFIPAMTEKPTGTILIAHGGGFAIRTGCEGPNAALHFHDLGYNTAILTYRLYPYSRRDNIADMLRAVRTLRSRKSELGITGRIAVMGFSAGGMLCGNCATHFDLGNENSTDPVERESSRPDAAVIGYGAITGVSFPRPFMMPPDYAHDMCGENMEERLYLAPEKNIRWNTPPFFIWQTLSDDGRYGMQLAKALADAEIPYELHIFDGGAHGIGIADGENDLGLKDSHVAQWTVICDEWLQRMGFR